MTITRSSLEAFETKMKSSPTLVGKKASLGGEQEQGFEEAFGSLAYAYIKDKAPKLMDYVVGFQLVDRNEDSTKAMGVFGFQVGKQWLYAPVFFLNGDLKGHELLYVKSQDVFVPLKENWVNYLMNKDPQIMGEGSADARQLGASMPNIETLIWPPDNRKYGSDSNLAPWLKPVMPLIASAMLKRAKFMYPGVDVTGDLDLQKVAEAPVKAAFADLNVNLDNLLRANVNIASGAHSLTTKYPGVKVGFNDFYGADYFKELGEDFLKRAKECDSILSDKPEYTRKKKKQASLVDEPVFDGPTKVAVVTREDVPVTNNLTDSEKEKALYDGYMIRDRRTGDEVTVAYNTQVEASLVNPKETSIYETLVKPGDFERMLIINGPYSNGGAQNFSCVVDASANAGKRRWLNAHRTTVWTKDADFRSEYQDWFEDLSDLSSLEKGAKYVAVNDKGQGTVPFTVRDKHDDEHYTVDFHDHCAYSYRAPDALGDNDVHDLSTPYVSPYDADLFINKRPGTMPKAMNSCLYLPDNFKVIKLEPSPKPVSRDDSLLSDSDQSVGVVEPNDGSRNRPIAPGDISDIHLLFTEKTARLKLYADHNEVSLSTKLGTARRSWTGALCDLVKYHGLREKAAAEMLKVAQRKGQAVYRLKYAAPYPLMGEGPTAPAIPEQERGSEAIGHRQQATVYPSEEFMQVDGLQASLTDPNVYDPFGGPDDRTMAVAQQAAQTGQKEVFDTAMISGMLKAVRQDSLVDRHLGDLMKALDKLCRLLFMFYWHQDDFEERYGKQDLPELEDMLRNALEVLGDVVLFLKEKSVDSPAGIDDMSTDIAESANN